MYLSPMPIDNYFRHPLFEIYFIFQMVTNEIITVILTPL